jgi:hypothetical protein
VALQRIAADLRSASPLSSDRQFVGQTRLLNGVEADLVDFATHHYTPQNPREGDFCEASYFLDQNPETGVYSLWRRRDASPDLDAMDGGLRELIVEGLRGLRFEYYDGLYWHDDWGDPEGKLAGRAAEELPLNATGMPEAVRISIWIDAEPQTRSAAERPAGEPATAASALMFQTVARLNLAPMAAYRSSGGADDAESNEGGEP